MFKNQRDDCADRGEEDAVIELRTAKTHGETDAAGCGQCPGYGRLPVEHKAEAQKKDRGGEERYIWTDGQEWEAEN
jgi:hypothetical protein